MKFTVLIIVIMSSALLFFAQWFVCLEFTTVSLVRFRAIVIFRSDGFQGDNWQEVFLSLKNDKE